jgi:hypothetical protein
MQRNVSWKDLSPGRRVAMAILGCVQVALAVAAWRDLAKRSAAQLNGSKRVWAAVIAINWIGPILYFTKGRKA